MSTLEISFTLQYCTVTMDMKIPPSKKFDLYQCLLFVSGASQSYNYLAITDANRLLTILFTGISGDDLTNLGDN